MDRLLYKEKNLMVSSSDNTKLVKLGQGNKLVKVENTCDLFISSYFLFLSLIS